jgi:PAS domain-containing protein
MTISFHRSASPDVTTAATGDITAPEGAAADTPPDIALGGFQMIGLDWRYLYVNPVAARHGRTTPQALVGRKVQEAYPGIEATPVFQELRRCMEERCVSTIETEFRFADGTRQWFEVRIQPTSEGICVYSIDIGARRARRLRPDL